MNTEKNNIQLPLSTKIIKSKKSIELKRHSPLVFSVTINYEKEYLISPEIEKDDCDDEILAILKGDDKYLHDHFTYDGNDDIMKKNDY